MQRSYAELANLRGKLLRKVSREFDAACENEEELIEFLNKFDLDANEKIVCVNTRTMKILVLGQLKGKQKDYLMAAKKMGITSDHIDIIGTYEDAKRFNIAMLENSLVYSDIIVGAIPHKVVGVEGRNSSFLQMVEANPDNYPKVIKATNSNELALTIASFKRALANTNYIDNL